MGYSGDIIFMTWIVDMDDYEFAESDVFPIGELGNRRVSLVFWATKIKSTVRFHLVIRDGYTSHIQPQPTCYEQQCILGLTSFDLYPCVMSWLNFLEDPKIGWETYWEDDQAALRLGWEYAQTTSGIWDRRSNKFCRSNLGTIHWQAPLSENEQWNEMDCEPWFWVLDRPLKWWSKSLGL